VVSGSDREYTRTSLNSAAARLDLASSRFQINCVRHVFAYCLYCAYIHFFLDIEDCQPALSIVIGGVRPVRFLLSKHVSMIMSRQPDLLILKLIEKLRDADPVTRRNAAGALRLQGARAVSAIPAISALLTDEDPRVRSEAERAVDHLKLVAA
jgi:hypothetical protein